MHRTFIGRFLFPVICFAISTAAIGKDRVDYGSWKNTRSQAEIASDQLKFAIIDKKELYMINVPEKKCTKITRVEFGVVSQEYDPGSLRNHEIVSFQDGHLDNTTNTISYYRAPPKFNNLSQCRGMSESLRYALSGELSIRFEEKLLKPDSRGRFVEWAGYTINETCPGLELVLKTRSVGNAYYTSEDPTLCSLHCPEIKLVREEYIVVLGRSRAQQVARKKFGGVCPKG